MDEVHSRCQDSVLLFPPHKPPLILVHPSRHRIHAASKQWLASENSQNDQADGGNEGATLEGFLGVVGAGGHETAVAAEEPAQPPLVTVYARQQDPAARHIQFPEDGDQPRHRSLRFIILLLPKFAPGLIQIRFTTLTDRTGTMKRLSLAFLASLCAAAMFTSCTIETGDPSEDTKDATMESMEMEDPQETMKSMEIDDQEEFISQDMSFFEDMQESSTMMDDMSSDMESMQKDLEEMQTDLEAAGCKITPSVLQPLSSTAECNQCKHHFLPGIPIPSPYAKYAIHSDLPEILKTPGVAYATVPVLPPFTLNDGTPVTQEMRTQDNNGFETIDGPFEVFLFHISTPSDGSAPRRMVVYVENAGTRRTTLRGKQVIVTDGIIGTVHEMESTLGRRVLEEDWDTPVDKLILGGGEGGVIAYSKVFSAPSNGRDSSANVNCFGLARVDIDERRPADLNVYVVAIPGDVEPRDMADAAKALLNQGAQSGETYLDLNTKPEGCQLRRACGVFEAFIWQGQPLTMDSVALAEEPVKFQMALPEIQSAGCENARQTVDLLLSQKSNRPDTVGNYMVEYRVPLRLINKSEEKIYKVDLRFGKPDADIGLGWKVYEGDIPATEDQMAALPVRTGWAGPKQDTDMFSDERSFLETDGPILIPPCGVKWVELRFMVLGNSSLPFQIGMLAEAVEE